MFGSNNSPFTILPTILTYLYIFACHENEQSLCHLEMRSLFGSECTLHGNYLISHINIDPSRSPFIKEQVAIMYEGSSVQEISEKVKDLQLNGAAFKVVFVETTEKSDESEKYGAVTNDEQTDTYDKQRVTYDKQTVTYDQQRANESETEERSNDGPARSGNTKTTKISFDEQRAIEREIGWKIQGKADMRHPDRLFGIARLGRDERRWVFGEYRKAEAIWLHHQNKPQNYSTALSTRIARAIVNIAVPNPLGIKAVDPCCGMGTVLIEALSMGINIIGFDINPLAIRGARMNLAHFGMPDVAAVGDIRALGGHIKSDTEQFESGHFNAGSEQFDAVSKQFESVSEQFDAVSKQFESVSEQFDAGYKHFESVFEHFGSVPVHFDVAIVDLPYNLCSVLTSAEQLYMLKSAKRIAVKAVIISTETIDSVIEQVGFSIADRCFVKKGSFIRHVVVCFENNK